MVTKEIIHKLFCILEELEARECSNNCINSQMVNKSWATLCGEGIKLFQELNESYDDAKNVRFETGDYAKIVRNVSDHSFEIGTIVKLEKYTDDYKAFANGDYWWVTDDDLIEIDDNLELLNN